MGKIFIINDGSITGGVASTHDVGTSSLTWRHGYYSGTVSVGTVSATGNALIGGVVSAVGAMVTSASLTVTTGTIIAAKITATTGSFTALLTAGTASISGAIIGGTSVTAGTGSFSGNLFVGGTTSVTGQLISAHTAGVVGQLAALTYTFGTDSTLQVTSIPTPFAGSIDQVYVTTGSVSAVVAQYTVQVGSAGSVAVATVANTTASQGVQEALTTSATTYAITNGLVVTRSAQGTAGDTAICIVVRKTA